MTDGVDRRMHALARLALAVGADGDVKTAVRNAHAAGLEPYEIAELGGLPMRTVLEILGSSE